MKTKKLVHLAMLAALTVLLGVIPNLGIIQIGVVSLTILHIPVLIAAFLYGVEGGIFMGLVFGVTSWFVASTRGASPIDLLFVNPLVSVMPRILFGAASGFLYRLVGKDGTWIKNAIVGVIGSLIHSILVLTCIFVFGILYTGSDFVEGLKIYIAFIIAANVLPEALFAGFVCASVSKAIKRVIHN